MSQTSLTTGLLEWYDANARDLPWRAEASPYRTLLSELMLQQTRVETVVPYFERFVARWPTLHDLAAADVEDVVEAWSGLGYYSRARRLHAACVIAARRGGLPGDLDGLRALPGIGPYTAGAIGSIAFGLRVPAIDGNVERVLSRLDASDLDPRSPAGRKSLTRRALELVPTDRPGDFNQALMELGATVCTPRSPSCSVCPWQVACQAEDPSAFPNKPKRTPPRPVRACCAWIEDGDGRVLVAKRPDTGLLAGLWELPGGEGTDLATQLRARLGVTASVGVALGEVVHVFSHRRLTLSVHVATVRGQPVALGGYQDLRWIRADSPDCARSSLLLKTLALGTHPQLLLLAADVHQP